MEITEVGQLTGIPEEAGLEWRIENFFTLTEDDSPSSIYTSPTFSFARESWRLALKINFETNTIVDGNIRLKLCRSTNGPPIDLDYIFSVKMQDGSKYRETRGSNNFLGWSRTQDLDQDPYKNLVLERNVGLDWSPECRVRLDYRSSKFVPDGTLTVTCRLKRFDPTEGNAGVSRPDSTKDKILQDFKEMFLNQQDCDVLIKVMGTEFRAHSFILKARSPVFASALRNDMKEKATGIIDIEDLDPSSFSDFLHFLYCGEVNDFSTVNTLFGLFTAADKYYVPDLRAKCIELLKGTLCINTFCDVMRFALLHSEADLIDSFTDFFIKNASNIVQTVQWQTFSAQNPSKCCELLTKFVISGEAKPPK